jgi:SSS family solute:Na+ symporter
MSIACANLFTPNLYKEFIQPDCTEAQEVTMAKVVSLVVKIGAVVFILALPHDYAIQLQLSAASGSSSFCPRSARALYALTQCASSSAGMGVGLAAGTYMAAAQGFTHPRSFPCRRLE